MLRDLDTSKFKAVYIVTGLSSHSFYPHLLRNRLQTSMIHSQI